MILQNKHIKIKTVVIISKIFIQHLCNAALIISTTKCRKLIFYFFKKKQLEMKYVELVHYKSLIFEVKRYPRKGTLFIVSIFIP